MSLGERGGTTATFQEAQDLIDAQKVHWREAVRADILETLAVSGEWHADDLITLGVPADSKKVIGAAVGGLVSSGLIEETGERRRSQAPESHGRKSNVYRLTEKGRQKLRSLNQITAGESLGGPETASRGGSSPEGIHRSPSPANPGHAAAISGRESLPQGGGRQHSSPAAALPTLFEVEGPRPRSHYEDEAA